VEPRAGLEAVERRKSSIYEYIFDKYYAGYLSTLNFIVQRGPKNVYTLS
jgi:hypothetical protein